MSPSRKEQEKKWGQILAKAWTDPHFKEKLLKNPHQTLKEMGIAVAPGRKIEIHENTDRVVHITLPQKPSQELTEEDVKQVAAGGTCACEWDY